jgi:hypothetical protein
MTVMTRLMTITWICLVVKDVEFLAIGLRERPEIELQAVVVVVLLPSLTL